MYTYGAVATSKSPLEDLSRPSRSFRGLRCYTETILTGSRQTDIAAIFRQDLYHAKVPTLVLHWKMDSEYFPGAGRPELPRHRRGRAGDIDHHWMKNYIDRLVHLQLQGKDVSHQAPFNYSKQFAVLSFGAYEKAKYWRTGEQATMESLIKRHLHKWNLVAQTQQDTLEAVDNMFLVQNHETLDCVLAFEGTHSFNEFGRNLEGAGDGYCGFQGVHKGYADKLYWLMTFSMPKLRHSLSKCNKAGGRTNACNISTSPPSPSNFLHNMFTKLASCFNFDAKQCFLGAKAGLLHWTLFGRVIVRSRSPSCAKKTHSMDMHGPYVILQLQGWWDCQE